MSTDGPQHHTEMLSEEEGYVLEEHEIHMKYCTRKQHNA